MKLSFQMKPITVSVIMTASPLEVAVSNTLAHPGEGLLLAPASQHCLGAPAMEHLLNAWSAIRFWTVRQSLRKMIVILQHHLINLKIFVTISAKIQVDVRCCIQVGVSLIYFHI